MHDAPTNVPTTVSSLEFIIDGGTLRDPTFLFLIFYFFFFFSFFFFSFPFFPFIIIIIFSFLEGPLFSTDPFGYLKSPNHCPRDQFLDLLYEVYVTYDV